MAKKISEDTEVQLDLKTIGMIVGGAIALAATYFTLTAEIELAKELPKPDISRTEFDLKDELIRSTIIDIDEKVDKNAEKLEDIDEKLYQLIKEYYNLNNYRFHYIPNNVLQQLRLIFLKMFF